MRLVAEIAVLVVALLHGWFLVLEMFLWDTPFGRRVLRLSPEYSAASKVLAANQGLYNGFLAAGLLWGLWLGSLPIQAFFLACVVVAGVFGGLTASRKILFMQALPGAVAIGLLIIS